MRGKGQCVCTKFKKHTHPKTGNTELPVPEPAVTQFFRRTCLWEFRETVSKP